MNTGDALLAAVLAHPNEDTPRLIYADWLQEQDDSRAEWRARLIRLMCANHEIRVRRDDKWTVTPRGALRAVRGELNNLLGPPLPTAFNVHRGFVCWVGLTLDAFLRDAAAIFAAHPISEVQLTDRAPLGTGRNQWTWYASFNTANSSGGTMKPKAHWVGEEIGNRLADALITERLPLCRQYTSKTAAVAALSAACVAHGRATSAALRG